MGCNDVEINALSSGQMDLQSLVIDRLCSSYIYSTYAAVQNNVQEYKAGFLRRFGWMLRFERAILKP